MDWNLDVEVRIRVQDVGGGSQFVWQAFLVIDEKEFPLRKSQDYAYFATSTLAKDNAVETLGYLAHKVVWRSNHRLD